MYFTWIINQVFWTNMLDSALATSSNHQMREYLLEELCSKTCKINAKVHWICSGSSRRPNTFLTSPSGFYEGSGQGVSFSYSMICGLVKPFETVTVDRGSKSTWTGNVALMYHPLPHWHGWHRVSSFKMHRPVISYAYNIFWQFCNMTLITISHCRTENLNLNSSYWHLW